MCMYLCVHIPVGLCVFVVSCKMAIFLKTKILNAFIELCY